MVALTRDMARDVRSTPIVLDVAGLSVRYLSRDGAPVQAVDDVSFVLHQGEILGVVGESGCGKSTLMLSLLRLLPAAGRITAGSVDFRDQDLLSLPEAEMARVRWDGISMIFQGAMNALNPVRRVGDQIAEAILRHEPALRRGKVHHAGEGAAQSRVEELLELVGIPAWRGRQFPHQYSGGMRQRAMIAMALACNPAVVIADEPTTALDVMVQAQILELLASLRDQLGLAIIFVTHDLGVVAELCDSVLVMYGGAVAEYADVDTIFNSPRHPYTRELLKAFPDISRPAARLAAIPGSPPRLDPPPPGCRFAPRCPLAFARCATETPALRRLEPFHEAACHLAAEL